MQNTLVVAYWMLLLKNFFSITNTSAIDQPRLFATFVDLAALISPARIYNPSSCKKVRGMDSYVFHCWTNWSPDSYRPLNHSSYPLLSLLLLFENILPTASSKMTFTLGKFVSSKNTLGLSEGMLHINLFDEINRNTSLSWHTFFTSFTFVHTLKLIWLLKWSDRSILTWSCHFFLCCPDFFYLLIFGDIFSSVHPLFVIIQLNKI